MWPTSCWSTSTRSTTREGRVDLLAAVSQATAEQVLGGALPSPAVLAEGLSPLAAQGRLVGWATDDDEQALLEAIHLSGALPDLAGGDGVAVVLNNAGENRLDVYLRRELDYEATVDTDTGEVSATATVTLTNTAPSSGLPDSVIGSDAGDDPGTNRTLVSLYSALPIDSATVTRERDHRPRGNGRAGAVRSRAGHRGRMAGRFRARRDTTGRVGHGHVRAVGDACHAPTATRSPCGRNRSWSTRCSGSM